ncbi:hypothetical protein, partial [Acinetobacter baumannii]|uniref:hypothetical protein n=1 Tax=Acinetobacter baumannii TaxID=470 RepID=UPI001A7EAC2D
MYESNKTNAQTAKQLIIIYESNDFKDRVEQGQSMVHIWRYVSAPENAASEPPCEISARAGSSAASLCFNSAAIPVISLGSRKATPAESANTTSPGRTTLPPTETGTL